MRRTPNFGTHIRLVLEPGVESKLQAQLLLLQMGVVTDCTIGNYEGTILHGLAISRCRDSQGFVHLKVILDSAVTLLTFGGVHSSYKVQTLSCKKQSPK